MKNPLRTPSLAVVLAVIVGVPLTARADEPTPIARGPHVSGVVRYSPGFGPTAVTAAPASCSRPGGGNFITNCHGTGRPVNETWIATNGSLFVAGANDYNSYNGQGQDGFYWSSDGTTWNDAGPIDVFPHNTNNASGDPGLAIDSNGVVYYSSLFFNFYSCRVGGVELLRRDPVTGAWSSYQIAANSRRQFQDKPAIAIDSSNVYVSWTQFRSCTGVNVTSPIKVAVLPLGASSAAPAQILSVPGSTYSQGSSVVSDGTGGIWVAWEEYPSSSATTGSIMLAHWTPSVGWNTPVTISPGAFKDLPSPLPGFKFRDNSFPAIAVTSAGPQVTWTSYDTGVGRAYLWSGGTVTAVSDAGGDQFFPAITGGGQGVYVSYGQTNPGTASYDQYVTHVTSTGTTVTKVSTASSYPNQDAFFSGQFIGDYNGMVFSAKAHAIWTDIRGPDPNYPGYEMDAMTAVTP